MSKNTTRVKTEEEIQAMREGGKMLAEVLEFVRFNTKVGMTTREVAGMARAKLKELGGEPAFEG